MADKKAYAREVGRQAAKLGGRKLPAMREVDKRFREKAKRGRK